MIVADVNLLAYLLISGPHTPAAERCYVRDRRWIAPRYYKFELLNILSSYCRFQGMTLNQATAIWHRALRMIPGFAIEPDSLDVLEMSVDLKLATYDCEYVVLARMRKLKLVTADQKVLDAVPEVAVSIEDFAAGK